MKLTILALSLAMPALAGAQERLAFVPLDQPCRLLDTRVDADAGGPLLPGQIRSIEADGHCGIPMEAKGIEANVTVTNSTGPGFLSALRPAGRIPRDPVAKTSLLNYVAGRDVANSALIMLGDPNAHTWDGVFWLLSSVSGTDVVVDVVGYYVVL